MYFMLFEQSELDINFLSLAVALSNFTYKVGNVCLIECANVTFISRINFILSRVEYEKSFVTSGPGLTTYELSLISSGYQISACLANIYSISSYSVLFQLRRRSYHSCNTRLFYLICDGWTFPSLSNGCVHFHLSLKRRNFSFLFHFSMKFVKANKIAPDGTPRLIESHLGLIRLLLIHKKHARIICVLHFHRIMSRCYGNHLYGI